MLSGHGDTAPGAKSLTPAQLLDLAKHRMPLLEGCMDCEAFVVDGPDLTRSGVLYSKSLPIMKISKLANPRHMAYISKLE